jgi:hypothetical protein
MKIICSYKHHNHLKDEMAQLKQAIMISFSKHNCLLILSTLFFIQKSLLLYLQVSPVLEIYF